MEPKQAWGAFSLVVVMAVIALSAALFDFGYDPYPITMFALVALVLYTYVLYKRYHVEVVPGNDILLFDDVDDLRILSGIYGLDETGDLNTLRQRLVVFAQSRKSPFTWVAPKAVLRVSSALEVPPGPQEKKAPPLTLAERMLSDRSPEVLMSKGLLGGRTRSSWRLSTLVECPICYAELPESGTICSECGADLEFYAMLMESRVGKRLISEKAGAVRRKLRYDVPHLEGTK